MGYRSATPSEKCNMLETTEAKKNLSCVLLLVLKNASVKQTTPQTQEFAKALGLPMAIFAAAKPSCGPHILLRISHAFPM